MKRGVIGLSFLGMCACGGGAPAAGPSKPVSTVVVPESKDTDEKSDPTPAPDDRAPPTASDFASCVDTLRAAPSLASAGEDRALYDRALAAEKAGDLSTARKTYYELISKNPTSKLIPLAYLAFGEMFAKEASSDPSKWNIAQAAFQEVLKYPPPENIAYPYASLRYGDSLMSSDKQNALSSYTRAAEASQQTQSLPCSNFIFEEAKKRVVEAFASVGAPDKAWSFFVAKYGDSAAKGMLRELSRAYKNQGKNKDACQAVSAAPSGTDDALKREACGK